MKIYKVIIIVKYTAESSSSNSFRWNLISAKEKQNQWRFSEKFTDEGRDLELFLAQKKKTSWNSISQIWHFCKFLSVTQIACNLLWEPTIDHNWLVHDLSLNILILCKYDMYIEIVASLWSFYMNGPSEIQLNFSNQNLSIECNFFQMRWKINNLDSITPNNQ